MDARQRVGLGEVESLVRAIARDADLRVERGAAGAGWRIHVDDGVVVADPADLDGRPREWVLGLAVHEAAHASITRYPHLLDHDALHAPGRRALLNALEDCRIEDWMTRRFVGVKPWVELYNDELFPPEPPGFSQHPLFRQFCLGCIYRWWNGRLPRDTDPRVVDALRRTESAREQVVQHVPPVPADVVLDELIAYASGPAAAVYRALDPFDRPGPFEQVVRLAAYRSLEALWREVLPVYDELVKQDLEAGRSVAEEEGRLLRRLREVRVVGLARARAGGRHEGLAGERVAEVDESMRHAMNRVLRGAPESRYEQARRDVAPLVQRLVDELERVLRPASYPRWYGGFPWGARVDLRRAMQAEADPRPWRGCGSARPFRPASTRPFC